MSSRKARPSRVNHKLRLEKAWSDLNRDIVDCQRCPRLIQYCREVARTKRRAYQDHDYWGGPVPNFVAPAPAGQARKESGRRDLLIVGLAPGAHGANRTGRMFTGDRSGDWLYRALHRGGLASQAESIDCKDGLRLNRCVITAACHCAPPGNKPTLEEFGRCRDHLERTMQVCRPRVILALGKLAWDATRKQLQESSIARLSVGLPEQLESRLKAPAFQHGALWEFSPVGCLIGSYHPSQQNTFTGRLTEEMLDEVIQRIVDLLD